MATYVVDPTLLPPEPKKDSVPMPMPSAPTPAPAPTVKLSIPNMALPFAKFDTTSRLSTATSILNWASLIACFIFVFLWGQKGLTSGRAMLALVVCSVFTLVSSVLMSTSGYKQSEASKKAIADLLAKAKM